MHRLRFFSCLFIQLLMLHTLSSTFFLLYTHMLLLLSSYEKDDYVLSLSLTHTSTFARRESLSTLHDVVVNVFFLSLHCCCSVYVDSYLFLSYKRGRERYAYNKAAHAVDKLLTARMHLCVCSFFFTSPHFLFFFLHIINFPFL